MGKGQTGRLDIEDFYGQLAAFYDAGDYSGAERFLIKSEKDTCCNDDWALLVAVYNEQGTFFRMTGRYHQSVESFRNAKKNLLPRMGEHCSEYATLLNNLAGTYRLAGKYDQAMILFTEALHIYKDIRKEDSLDCANVHHNVALLYQELELYSRAVEHLKLALEVTKHHTDAVLQAAVTYSNLTSMYYKMKEEQEAAQCMEKALNLLEQCKVQKNDQYVPALNSMAGCLYSMGEYERSARVYQEAAEYTKKFFGENLDYATSMHSQFWAYRELGSMSKAREALETTWQVYRKIFGAAHERTLSVSDELKKLKREMTHPFDLACETSLPDRH